jgi:hypothetical protein
VYNTKIFKVKGPSKAGLYFWVSYTSCELEKGGVDMVGFLVVYSAALLDLVYNAIAIIDRGKE